jgi:hypothetical protein
MATASNAINTYRLPAAMGSEEATVRNKLDRSSAVSIEVVRTQPREQRLTER